jgi:hypothetical protein
MTNFIPTILICELIYTVIHPQNQPPLPPLAPYLDRPLANPHTNHMVIAAYKCLCKFLKSYYFAENQAKSLLTSVELQAHIHTIEGVMDQARELEAANAEKLRVSRIICNESLTSDKTDWSKCPGF